MIFFSQSKPNGWVNLALADPPKMSVSSRRTRSANRFGVSVDRGDGSLGMHCMAASVSKGKVSIVSVAVAAPVKLEGRYVKLRCRF